MDLDDDDAFLYGDQSPPPQAAAVSAPSATEAKPDASASNLSASMAASLAAYGIDPTTAVAAENPEDGGVEEEDPEDDDEDDSDDEDDVKLVFNATAQRLDLRRQAQPSNVIGIGKWAHTSTGADVAPATPATPQKVVSTPRAPVPTANQTTEYTPTSRPGATPTSTTATHAIPPPLQNNPIPPSGDSGTAPNIQPPSQYPPVALPNGTNGFDPANPSGIIPSTGNSVYDIDLAQFEGSGQSWRRPGSDLQDYFNYGFDEVTYLKYLRYKQEMEAGRQALLTMQMGAMTPEIANLLHLPPMMNMNMNMGNMGMGQMPFNPQQMQAMQQAMAMGGMDPAMMQQMQQMQQQQQQQQPQQQQHQHQPQQQQQQQQQPPQSQRPPPPQRPSATPGPQEEGDEAVKKEEGSETPATVPEPVAAPLRGQVPLRGMVPGRGTALRGRGGAIPSGPRAGVALPSNIPTGPKAGRFRDKDRVEIATSNLDYGDDDASGAPAGPAGNSLSRRSSQSGSPVKAERRSSRRYRERSHDDREASRSPSRSASPVKDRTRRRERDRRDKDREDDYDSGDRRDKRGSGDRDRERDRDGERSGSKKEKRKRDDGGSAVLGPGGWESEEEESRSSRRRRSPSTADEGRYSRKSKRR